MGSFSVYCDISRITITEGDDCVFLVLRDKPRDSSKYKIALPPIYGCYNDYGTIKVDKERTPCEELFKKHFNVEDVQEFVDKLIDNQDTRNKYNIDYEGLHYTFIHRDVWDYLSSAKLTSKYDKPITDKDFTEWGMRVITGEDGYDSLIPNLYLNILNSTHVNEIIDVLSKTPSDDTWERIKLRAKVDIGSKAYYEMESQEAYNRGNTQMGDYYKRVAKETNDRARMLMAEAFQSDLYKDKFWDMFRFMYNLNVAAYALMPYLHLSNYPPQCGEFELHQQILDKFAEINRKKVKEGIVYRAVDKLTYRRRTKIRKNGKIVSAD